MLANCYSPATLLQDYLRPDTIEASCRILLEDAMSPQTMGGGAYLFLFLLTNLLEAPVYGAALGFTRRSLLKILILNLATHPLVTWGFSALFTAHQLPVRDYVLVSELFAPTAEALLLQCVFNTSPRRAWLTAFAANLFSWWLGPYLASFSV